MSYLYVTAGIFPHHNTTFAVLDDSLLESVITLIFVSNWNLFLSNFNHKRLNACLTDERLHINYRIQIHVVEDTL